MSRTSKFALIIVAILAIGYSAAWYSVMSNITSDYNLKYANKNLSPDQTHISQDAKGTSIASFLLGSEFSFDKARAVGFPFKWSVAFDNLRIKQDKEKIEFQSEVEEGYNVLTQSRYIKYNGNVVIKNNADVITHRVEDIKSDLSVKMIPTSGLVKKLLKGDYSFELINYAGIAKLSIENLKIYNEPKTEKYYDLDHLALELDFDKPFYYTKMDDLLDYPPQAGLFSYSIKSNKNQYLANRFKNFAELFLNPFTSKMNINFINKADVEVNIIEFTHKVPSFYEFSLNGNFKGNKEMNNFQIDLKSNSEIGENYYNFLKALYNNKNFAVLAQNNSPLKDIQFIINHEDNFYLKEFVNKRFNFDLKGELKDKQFKVDNVSLSSGNTFIQLNGEGAYKENGGQAKGVLFLGNFAKLIDVCSGYVLLGLQAEKILDWSDESQKMIADVGKIFLRSIADYPDSAARDLSISYEIDSNNFFNSKIGNANIAQVGQLFYQALVKGGGKKLEQLMPGIMPGMMPGMDQGEIIMEDMPQNQNTEAPPK